MPTAVAFMDYDTAIGAYRFIRLTDADPEMHSTYGGQHEEGWSRTYNTWTLDRDIVTFTSYTDGCDCDGRMSTYAEYTCHVSDLAKREPYAPEGEDPPPFKLPEWKEGSRSQRDYSAEAAGY